MVNTITCAMMVRDSEATLERALQSVEGYVDEIVIIDTGSTDTTPTIAKDYADIYEEKPWPGSFSEARNWTIDLATKEYIFILDSDEYVKDPERMWPGLRRYMRRGDIAALDVTVLNIAGGGLVEDEFEQVRLFRRDERIRYRASAHHQCQDAIRRYISAEGGRWLKYLAFTICHTGYDLDREGYRRKYRPRLPLYAMAVKEAVSDGDREYYRYQQGVALYLAGYPGSAVNILRKLNPGYLNDAQLMHALSIAVKSYLQLAIDGKPFDRADASYVASVLISRYPNSETIAAAGHLAAALEQPTPALELYCKAFLEDQTKARRIAPKELLRNITGLIRHQGHEDVAVALEEAPPEDQRRQVQFMLQAIGG